MKKKVYVAASFAYEDKEKTEQRKKEIEEVVSLIQEKNPDWNFYLPHKLKIPNAWDISLEEWSRAVYEHDVEELTNCDLVIFISYGKENNAGSVWEVGYVVGYQNGSDDYGDMGGCYPKEIMCIKMTNEPESLMVSCSCNIILKKEEIESYDWFNRPYYKTNLDKLS